MAQEPEIEKLEIADELIAERRAGKVGDTPEDRSLTRKPLIT